MHVIMIGKDKVLLEISKDELGTLGNALNEVCNGIKVTDFDTRIGVKIEKAEIILDFLRTTYINANEAIADEPND